MQQARSFSAGRIAALIALPLLLMGLAQIRVPYLSEIASHVADAHRIWTGGIDCAAVYRLPLGYAGWIAPFIAFFGEPLGVKLANMAALALLLGAVTVFLAEVRPEPAPPDSPPRRATEIATIAVLLVLTFHPYNLLNVARTTEALLAAALVVGLLCFMLRPPKLPTVILAGVLLGFGIHVRANMASLILPLGIWILWLGGMKPRPVLGFAAAGLASTAAAYAICSLLLAGCPWYAPTNGGYNLFAGTNAFSAHYFAINQNGEQSLLPALAADGISTTDAHAVPEKTYIDLARAYALECPLCVAKLVAQKAFVYFSPRLLSATGTAKVAVQTLIALPTLFAIALALWRFGRRRTYADGIVLLVFASYALPFILTNADPRLRFPLDMVALCYLAPWPEGWLRRRLAFIG